MKTDTQGNLIMYCVTDAGVEDITPNDPRWGDGETPVFEFFDDAMIFFTQAVASRLAALEGKQSTLSAPVEGPNGAFNSLMPTTQGRIK